MTPAEQRFYRVLVQAAPRGMTAFAKVRLLDVVNVPDRAWREYGAPARGSNARGWAWRSAWPPRGPRCAAWG